MPAPTTPAKAPNATTQPAADGVGDESDTARDLEPQHGQLRLHR